jgi:hypothetical protein
MTFIVEQTTDDDYVEMPPERPPSVFSCFLIQTCWWSFWLAVSVWTININPLFNIHFIDTMTPLGKVMGAAAFLWLCWNSAKEYVQRERTRIAADAAA